METAIDKYVTNVELLPAQKSFLSDLNIFSLVTKLLTGELLDHEYIDPNYVLMENVPKNQFLLSKILNVKPLILIIQRKKVFILHIFYLLV